MARVTQWHDVATASARPTRSGEARLPTGIAGPSDPRCRSVELLDGREPQVLGQDPIDLGILVIQGDREPHWHGPNGLILRAAHTDRVGAPTIRALTEVDVDAFVRPVVGELRPLVHLPEDGLVRRLLLTPLEHRYSGRPQGPVLSRDFR